MNYRPISCVFVSLLLATLLSVVACSTAPQTPDPNFLGNYPPRKLDTIMINSVKESDNKLQPLEVSYVFYPRKNTVEMNMYYEYNSVVITLSQANRTALLDAMKKYIEDYQAGILKNTKSPVPAYFGKTSVRMNWGMITATFFAKPEINFEYRYVTDKKPYFMLKSKMYPPLDEYGNEVKDTGASSPDLRLALTPIQCQHLIELLNQDALLKIVSDLDTEQDKFDIPETTTTTSDSNAMF